MGSVQSDLVNIFINEVMGQASLISNSKKDEGEFSSSIFLSEIKKEVYKSYQILLNKVKLIKNLPEKEELIKPIKINKI